MTESTDTARIRDEIVADGGIVVPLVGGMMSRAWPDRLVYHRLWHGLIEFKAPHGKLRADQRVNLKKLRARQPWHAVVVRFPDRVEDENGNLLVTFDGTGADLVRKLSVLSYSGRDDDCRET